jgi:hypothetical protein
MAARKQCDRCQRVDDGTLAGRVISHQYSPGWVTKELDLCEACTPRTTTAHFLKLGRQVGTGHLDGAAQLRNLPIVVPKNG